ncbi:MAG: hypothetical protein NHB32_12500 [Fischerella sp. CENA71]|nr:hypothetical protein [Fischerella sp. CENA71]
MNVTKAYAKQEKELVALLVRSRQHSYTFTPLHPF